MNRVREFIGFIFLMEGRASLGYVLWCWALLVSAFAGVCSLGMAFSEWVMQ